MATYDTQYTVGADFSDVYQEFGTLDKAINNSEVNIVRASKIYTNSMRDVEAQLRRAGLEGENLKRALDVVNKSALVQADTMARTGKTVAQVQREVARGEKQAQTEMAKTTREVERLYAKYDTLGNATRQREHELKILNTEMARQRLLARDNSQALSELSAQEARITSAIERRYNAVTLATNQFGVQNKNLRVNMRRLGMVTQQAGYQVGDLAVQLQGGINPAVALGQQGSQLLGIFGPLGAVLGATLAIVSAMFVPMLNSAEGTARLKEQLSGATGALATMSPLLDLVKWGVEGLGNAFKFTVELIVNNADILIGVATALALWYGTNLVLAMGRYTASLVASTGASIGSALASTALGAKLGFQAVATDATTAATTRLHAVLMRLPFYAVIAGAGYLIMKFVQLVKGAGGFGEAMKLVGNLFTSIMDLMVAQAGFASHNIAIAWNEIKIAFVTVINEMMSIWNQFLTAISGQLSSLGEVFNNIVPNSGKWLTDVSDKFREWGESAEWSEGKLKELKSQQADLIAGAVPAALRLADANAQVKNSFGALGDAMKAGGEKSPWSLPDIPKGFAEEADKAGKSAGGAAKGAGKLSDAAQKLKDVVEAATKPLKDFRETSSAIQQALSQNLITDIQAKVAFNNIDLVKQLQDVEKQLGGGISMDAQTQEIQNKMTEQTNVIQMAYEARLISAQDYQERLSAINRVGQEEQSKIWYENQSIMLKSTSDTFSSLSDIAKGFAGEQSGIYKAMFAASKAFAIADSVIKIQQGIAGALALPFPANFAAMAAVAAEGVNIVSAIQSVAGAGFRSGGYTGNYGTNKVAGVVHGQEYVLNANATRKIGKRNLDQMNQTGTMPNGNSSGVVHVVVELDNDMLDSRVSSTSKSISYEVVRKEAGKVVASEINNSNSPVSKSMKSNFNTARRHQ